MNIGFTGTRDGLTQPQSDSLHEWVREFGWWDEFIHGACCGADQEAAETFRLLKQVKLKQVVVARPGHLKAWTSAAALRASDVVRPAANTLVRNRDIVDACDILLACPKGPEEQRSGTWATVRYARKQQKRIVIFWPDGSVTEE